MHQVHVKQKDLMNESYEDRDDGELFLSIISSITKIARYKEDFCSSVYQYHIGITILTNLQ